MPAELTYNQQEIKMKRTVNVLFILQTRRNTSPPPRGGDPRLSIFRAKPSRGTPKCLSKGCSVGWFVSLLVREEVLLAGLCERKILFRLKIYDHL